MPYTAAQLTSIWTNVNQGIAPTTGEQLLINAYAAQNQAGVLSDAQALQLVLNSGDTDTAVAIQSYQFFTGASPSAAGLAYLVNSTTNTTDLNDPYYQQFNQENRYINFAQNLGLIGDGATAFATNYGGLTFAQTVEVAYETIIGSSYAVAAGINPAAAKADIISRLPYFQSVAATRFAGQNQDLAVKAAVIGYIMSEGQKADVGVYALATNNFMTAIGNNTATYNTNIVATYVTNAPGGGTGGQAGSTFNLTAGADNVVGTANNDTVNALWVASNSVNTDNLLANTFQAIDSVNGNGGIDTLNIVVTDDDGAATGNVTLPGASVSAVEVVNVRTLSTTAADVTTVNAQNFAGATAINADRSTNKVAVTNMAAGQAIGVIGTNTIAGGDVDATYATATSAATINLTSVGEGTTPAGPTVKILSQPTTVSINANGGFNVLANLGLSAGSAVSTLNIKADSSLDVLGSTAGFGGSATVTSATINVTGTAGVTLGALNGTGDFIQNLTINTNSSTFSTGNMAGTIFAAGATVKVAGAAATSSTTAAAVNLGTAVADIKAIDASGLTAGGVAVTVGANGAATFVGGAGRDIVTITGGAAYTGTINAGAGTDVVAFTTGGDLAANLTALVTGFETLRVSNAGAAGTTEVYDPTLISGITSYQIAASSGAVQLNNLVANASVTAIGSVAGTAGVRLNLANAGGAADAVTLTVANTATTGANVSGLTISSVTMGGSATPGQVETLNLVSAGRVTGTGADNKVTLRASGAGPNFADANKVVITGSSALELVTGVSGHAITIDASGFGNSLTLDNTTNAVTGVVTIVGSSSNDSIGSANTATIYGGGGGDAYTLGANVQTLVYKAAGESQLDLTGVSGASGTGTKNTGTLDAVTGFTGGSDKIDLTAFNFSAQQQGGVVDKGAAADAAAFQALLASATLFSDGILTRALAQVDVGADQYLIVDANKDGVYTAGADLVVRFVGTTANLVATDFIGN